MCALTAAANIDHERAGFTAGGSYEVTNTEKIFHGALVLLDQDSGRLRNLDDLSGTNDVFLGIAIPRTESVTGDTAALPIVECPVDESGLIHKNVAVTGASAISDQGAAVYATDENTFTLTPTTNIGSIGWVKRHVSGTTCDVQTFTPNQYRANQDLGQV